METPLIKAFDVNAIQWLAESLVSQWCVTSVKSKQGVTREWAQVGI